VALQLKAATPTGAFVLSWLVADIAVQNGTPSDSVGFLLLRLK
jgi:hypothetical protein